MIAWWNELTLATQIFYAIAIPATLVLLIQTVTLLIGIGGEADGLGDGPDVDVPDTDVSDVELPDGADGVFGDGETVDAADLDGLEGLRIFTVRGIVAFLVVFGWVGVVLGEVGAALWLTLPVATVSGFAVMVLLAWLFKLAMKLKNNGNLNNQNAVGVAGKVYLSIPPAHSGTGKVQLMLQGVYVERNAVTDDPEVIPTGSEIVVIGTSGQTDLLVRRK